MKKLFFISMIGLFAVSCQPTEFTCDCSGTGGGSVTVTGGLSLIDTNLIGHWKNTSPLVNLGSNTFSSNWTPVTDIDVYFSPDGIVHYSHTYNTTTSTGDSYNYFKDNQMPFNVIDDGILCIDTSIIIHYEINNKWFNSTHWTAGDGYLWDDQHLHVSGNAGFNDKYTLQVSGFIL